MTDDPSPRLTRHPHGADQQPDEGDPMTGQHTCREGCHTHGRVVCGCWRGCRACAVEAIRDAWDDQCAGNRNEDACESCRAYADAIRSLGGEP